MFDVVVKHLWAQGRRATSSDSSNASCKYRGIHGTKCAIGALIPDELYRPEIEGLAVSFTDNEYDKANKAKYEILIGILVEAGLLRNEGSEEDILFLADLQDIHDSSFGGDFRPHVKHKAEAMAIRYDLTMPEVGDGPEVR
jgi:hypothetical protein